MNRSILIHSFLETNVLPSKLIRFLIPFFLFTFAGSSAFAQTRGGYYTLVYSKSGVIGSIEFNGMTILPESNKEDVSGQIDLNVWVRSGVNKIKVKGIRKRKEDEFAPRFKAILYLAQKGQFPDEGQKIIGFEWEEGEGKPTLPLEEELSFTPTEIPPSELWKVAEEIELSAEDKEKIQKVITDLYNGFQKKDGKKLFELTQFKTKEFTSARYDSPEEGIQDLKKAIQTALKMFGGQLDKLDLKDLQYQIIADKKVVYVTSKSGESPIKGKKKGFSMEIYFSKIKGEWILSR